MFGALLLFLLFLDKYYVIFVDDFSRFTWLFLLKQKSEVFTVFLHFKTLVENQFGLKIKTLRTDGGGEYVNNSFKSLCLDHGIHHQLSYPYTPQQNGVAESVQVTSFFVQVSSLFV